MKNQNSLKQILVLLLLITVPTIVFAQPSFSDEVTDVPIDGGLSLLVAAGVGFASKKLKEHRKQSI